MTVQAPPRHPMARIAPRLAEISDQVLFGDVWARTQIAPRDRSIITVAALISLNRIEQLPFHVKKAFENGVTEVELGEIVTHLAFYAGWPCAASACSAIEKALP